MGISVHVTHSKLTSLTDEPELRTCTVLGGEVGPQQSDALLADDITVNDVFGKKGLNVVGVVGYGEPVVGDVGPDGRHEHFH